jgi:hypothetical protein
MMLASKGQHYSCQACGYTGELVDEPDEPPRRACTANLSLKPEAKLCAKAATHVITGLDGRLQWFGCDEHSTEAIAFGCKVEDWVEWYDQNILGDARGLQKWLNENA